MPFGSETEHCSVSSASAPSGAHSSSGFGASRVPKASNSIPRDNAPSREPIAQRTGPGRPSAVPPSNHSSASPSASNATLEARSSAPLSSVLSRMQGHPVSRRTPLSGLPTDSRLLRRSAGRELDAILNDMMGDDGMLPSGLPQSPYTGLVNEILYCTVSFIHVYCVCYTDRRVFFFFNI